jgi:hypothetical protein
VAYEQMLQDQVQAVVLVLIEGRVFEKGNVPGSANSSHLAEDAEGIGLEGLQLFTHAGLCRRGGFYDSGHRPQRYFGTWL